VSFYAWDYPVYRVLLSFGFTAIIFAIVLSTIVHYLSGAIRVQTPGPKITLAARRHLTILVFVFVVLKAIAYWLDRYGLVFSDRSKFTGASYTDVHAVLPARTILFWIAIVIAAGLIASLWLRSTMLPAIAFVSMLVLSILISGIYPAILQQVSVKPNASSKEAPYISRNIQATRQAYGIQTDDEVVYPNYDVSKSPDLTAPTEPNNATIENIRILDPNIISPTFAKFQQRNNVYGFAPKLDIDRYSVNRVEGDYIVGVRELDASQLSGQQTNWINSHTNYTHGYGFVAANAGTDVTSGNESTGQFSEGGIPPTGFLTNALKNNAVYYGELMPDYSIVGATGAPQEFDGNGSSKVTYKGGGGISLSSVISRLAFAVHYKQTNFLLNNAASADGAKIIFNRDPRAMVQKAAPFVKVDSDPFPIVDTETGDIVWMVDGYTTINNYPYSEREALSSVTNDSLAATNKTAKQPNDEINYIRNSVKATVDAYTGKVTLYAWQPNDPVLKAWRSVFPGLVKNKNTMPTSILSHVRYPQDLFKAQRTLLGVYHVDDPVTFYNVSRKWTVPDDPTNGTNASQPPYYVLAAAPTGSASRPEFQLTSPMNVNNSTYLAAYMSVNSDPNSAAYGKITVLQVPAGSNVVQGPEQVYNSITTDNIIRRDSLYATGSNSATVLHGNLLTLPLDKSFMYVEPLYTVSTNTTGAYPSLQRVIVVYGSKIGYGATLEAALSDFKPGHTTGQTLALTGSTPTPDNTGGGSSSTPTPSPSSGKPSTNTGGKVTLQQLDNARAERDAAIASGDQVRIAQAEVDEQKLWDSYLKQQGIPTATPTATPHK
jgi:uncharacterized protein